MVDELRQVPEQSTNEAETLSLPAQWRDVRMRIIHPPHSRERPGGRPYREG